MGLTCSKLPCKSKCTIQLNGQAQTCNSPRGQSQQALPSTQEDASAHSAQRSFSIPGQNADADEVRVNV